MSFRRLSVGATSFVAVGLASLAVAWACTTNADMVLANASNMTWDPGSSGKNFSECPLSEFTSATHCKRPVNVTGTGFLDSDPGTPVGPVDLYWIDEPFFVAGAGIQHAGERVAGEVCRTKGVKLTTTSITVNSSGGFSKQVDAPPTAGLYADGTVRPQNVYYGANAICAVWFHDMAGTLNDHYSGFANQYTIYPI